ncbi:hypothetical protein DPEC_G00134660 [Dallia pectoralis]|uniref:Uncharacterized protein n=1 Tax=Dallia pectoralis TaxID=75939 RepID=A0ACC2GRW9_DALPE|nr:hypothetical protein DPEC_G00134660 [Dallia pectoralis]
MAIPASLLTRRVIPPSSSFTSPVPSCYLPSALMLPPVPSCHSSPSPQLLRPPTPTPCIPRPPAPFRRRSHPYGSPTNIYTSLGELLLSQTCSPLSPKNIDIC